MSLRHSLATPVALSLLLSDCGPPSSNRTRLQTKYDPKTGRLAQLTYDSNSNGKPDIWSYMDGAKVLRIELDRDEDGRIERWEYYGADQQVEKIGLSRANDGKVDAWVYQGPDGTVARIEVSAARDGKVTGTEFYEKGTLVRIEEDTNGDGIVDKWETFDDGALTSVAFDSVGAGRPTRRLVYGKDGSLLRIETGAAVQNPPS